jgi:hypothetical protein
MNYKIFWIDVSDKVIYNFEEYCGVNDASVNSYEYHNNSKRVLSEFHAFEDREDFAVVFESEAYYHWFLLRFS